MSFNNCDETCQRFWISEVIRWFINAIKIKYPVVVTRSPYPFTILGRRILGTLGKSGSLVVLVRIHLVLIFALLPVTENVPMTAFSLELYHALTSVGPTLRLTSDIIKRTLRPTALDRANDYSLYSWLGQQEDADRIMLYQCYAQFSIWTQRCISQPNCDISRAIVSQVGRQLEHLAIRILKELILLHRDDGAKPKHIALWLNMRNWCSSSHHIRCPKRMFTKKNARNL